MANLAKCVYTPLNRSMIFGKAGLRKSRASCSKSVHIAVTRPCRFEILNGPGLVSRFRLGTAIVSGMSSAGSSGSTLLASCSPSEITTDCSPSCSVVFEHAVVDLFDFDFDAEVSEDTEVDSFYFDAETAEVADADAEILPLCGFLFFNFSFLSSC